METPATPPSSPPGALPSRAAGAEAGDVGREGDVPPVPSPSPPSCEPSPPEEGRRASPVCYLDDFPDW